MRSHGEPIQFQFGDVGEVFAFQQAAHARVEFAQFSFVERVVQAEHGRTVRHFDEAFAGLSAHSLGKRIGRDEFGMGVFERPKFPQKRVVFGVGDGGLIQNIVEMFVMFQLLAKRLGARGRRFRL